MDHDERLHELRASISPLELLEREAVGGMGEVYLARDPLLRRTVAIKLLRRDLVADGAARGRFLQEARIIAGLDHPHIIGIHSVGELPDGSPFYVMDYVDGDLSDVIPAAGLESPREAKRIVAALASALEAAHSAGVLHLDVKPSNVLYDAEHREAKLSDWGVAALMVQPGEDESSASSTGLIVGSPGYMSPEQVEGDRPGRRSVRSGRPRLRVAHRTTPLPGIYGSCHRRGTAPIRPRARSDAS